MSSFEIWAFSAVGTLIGTMAVALFLTVFANGWSFPMFFMSWGFSIIICRILIGIDEKRSQRR